MIEPIDLARALPGAKPFNEGNVSSTFRGQPANAWRRLICFYDSQAELVIQVAQLAIRKLERDLSEKGAAALFEFKPITSGILVGEIREGEGRSVEAIAASWMSTLSAISARS